MSLGECVAEHRKATDRFGLGRFVLQNVPMLSKKTVFEPDNVGGDPGGGSSHPGEAAVCYDVIAFGDDELVLIVQRSRNGAAEIEYTLATRWYVRAVLDVV